MERYLYACDLLNSFEARTYLVVVFGKCWKMAARDDFWDRFNTRVDCRVPLSIERGVRHWPSAPTRVVQRTCRVRTRVPTRVDYMSKRMHPKRQQIRSIDHIKTIFVLDSIDIKSYVSPVRLFRIFLVASYHTVIGWEKYWQTITVSVGILVVCLSCDFINVHGEVHESKFSCRLFYFYTYW